MAWARPNPRSGHCSQIAPTDGVENGGQGEEVSLNKPPKWAQVLIQQALQFALEINGQHYQAPRSQEFKLESPEAITPETLFDYETVADNVLQFVTGRLGAARADGKSDADLAEMMAPRPAKGGHGLWRRQGSSSATGRTTRISRPAWIRATS